MKIAMSIVTFFLSATSFGFDFSAEALTTSEAFVEGRGVPMNQFDFSDEAIETSKSFIEQNGVSCPSSFKYTVEDVTCVFNGHFSKQNELTENGRLSEAEKRHRTLMQAFHTYSTPAECDLDDRIITAAIEIHPSVAAECGIK